MCKGLQAAADEVWRIFGKMPTVIGIGLGGRGDSPVMVLSFSSDEYFHLVPNDWFGWPIDKEVVNGIPSETDGVPTPVAS